MFGCCPLARRARRRRPGQRAWLVELPATVETARDNVDDLGFVRALIEELGTTLSLDRDPFYAAGFSNGTIRLGCEITSQTTAIAPRQCHAGTGGLGQPAMAISATALMWEFFIDHPMPCADK